MSVPRLVLVALGLAFSAYQVVIAVFTLDAVPRVEGMLAIACYVVATIVVLAPWTVLELGEAAAGLVVGLGLATALLVTAHHSGPASDSVATWHTAAVGILLTALVARGRSGYALFGTVALVAQSIVWFGFSAITATGLVGSVIWVLGAYAAVRTLGQASYDARQYAIAERKAAAWYAAQEARLYERQFRVRQTGRMALPMLQRIAAQRGDLDDADRFECRVLEQALRDEIRGRLLLNDDIRRSVSAHRRRGANVQVLDDGGIDDVADDRRAEILRVVGEAIERTTADRLIIRTAPSSSATAVTVVGLCSGDGGAASALGDDDDDEVDLWLEVPRTA